MSQNTTIQKSQSVATSEKNLLIFELAYGGHFASYIRYLAQYWYREELSGTLNFVISPNFVAQHPDVVAIAKKATNIHFTAINPSEAAKLVPRNNSLNRAIRSFQEWQLLRKYAKQLQADSCLLLYFDSFQAAVASGLKLPCSFSGIYFRPTFHYSSFADYSPTRKEQIQHFREKSIILPRVMKHPQLSNLFCLDPFVVKHLERFKSLASITPLADPVPIQEIADEKIARFREGLGVEGDRKIFLFFGALYNRRKGIDKVLAAISQLSPDLCQKICLLLVGQIYLEDNPMLKQQMTEVVQKFPIQVIMRDEFVPEEDVQLYYRSADVILAPYQRHVGMSGVLVNAAAAQKPLLCSDYGLMGEITRQWKLGLTVDSNIPEEIARGLREFLEKEPVELSNKNKMKAFAMANSNNNFAKIIFQNV